MCVCVCDFKHHLRWLNDLTKYTIKTCISLTCVCEWVFMTHLGWTRGKSGRASHVRSVGLKVRGSRGAVALGGVVRLACWKKIKYAQGPCHPSLSYQF